MICLRSLEELTTKYLVLENDCFPPVTCLLFALPPFFPLTVHICVTPECETAQDVTAPGMQSSQGPLPLLINNY